MCNLESCKVNLGLNLHLPSTSTQIKLLKEEFKHYDEVLIAAGVFFLLFHNKL
jgi:hypothetical protein